MNLAQAAYGPRQQGARRLLNLVRHLPEESATARAEGDGWTMDRHLAVSMVELAHAQFRALRALGGDKKVRGEKPLVITRPRREERRPEPRYLPPPRRHAPHDPLRKPNWSRQSIRAMLTGGGA